MAYYVDPMVFLSGFVNVSQYLFNIKMLKYGVLDAGSEL